MPRRKRQQNQWPCIVRLVYCFPMTFVLLERLVWIPYSVMSSSPTYFKNLETTKDHKRVDHQKVPRLVDITKSTGDVLKCPRKTRMAGNLVMAQGLSISTTSSSGIPKIIHQAAETKCLAPDLYKTFSEWRKLDGYETYFHDSISVHRLLNVDFPEFPMLRSILRQCTKTFEAKMTLWKYLVLYTYGGIFAPLGSLPESSYLEGLAEQDAIFLFESNQKSLVPEFMAVSPKHPLIYYAIHHYILGVLRATNVDSMNYRDMSLYAMNKAMGDFQRDAGANSTTDDIEMGKRLVGTDDRSITLVAYKGGPLSDPAQVDSLHDPVDWKGSCMSEILSDTGGW